MSSVKIGSLDPGEYELRVTVIDRNAEEVATRQVGFTVD